MNNYEPRNPGKAVERIVNRRHFYPAIITLALSPVPNLRPSPRQQGNIHVPEQVQVLVYHYRYQRPYPPIRDATEPEQESQRDGQAQEEKRLDEEASGVFLGLQIGMCHESKIPNIRSRISSANGKRVVRIGPEGRK